MIGCMAGLMRVESSAQQFFPAKFSSWMLDGSWPRFDSGIQGYIVSCNGACEPRAAYY